MTKYFQIKLISICCLFCLTECNIADVSTESGVTEWITPSTIPVDMESSETTMPKITTLPEETAVLIEPAEDEFVRVKAYIPDIVVELRYASENNFVKQKIYNFSDAWLRYGTVKKLLLVQNELRQYGYGLKIWDGFRPVSAQFALWAVYPDPSYVANPHQGFSSHSCGNTVDITMVNSDGSEVVMPTVFDDFSKLADRDYSDCGKASAENAAFLEMLMIKHGFTPYFNEWWHFTDTKAYPVEMNFEPY